MTTDGEWKTHTRGKRTDVKCPVGGCPTVLQKTLTGTLVDGVRTHLLIVHDVPRDRALTIAKEYVNG